MRRYPLPTTQRGLHIDAFVIYTDNETWSGQSHVIEALKRYREKTGIPARLVAVGMTATNYSVVEPSDPLQLNVVGFDAAAPEVISNSWAARLEGRAQQGAPFVV
jgi:60 kDa SS-A/Ro ribonucleoprotein